MNKSKEPSSNRTRILMVAAEASSVPYAEQLITYWKDKSYSYFGVGSHSMEKRGFQCFGYAEEMAVMGFSEVIKHYSHIKSVYNQILNEIIKTPPKVAILIDYPGFNLRLSKDLHRLNIPVVYYISPQVWAWKKNRIKSIRSYVNQMLVVFPFEYDFYKEHGVPVEFVGHPLLDELKDDYFNSEWLRFRRGQWGIQEGDLVLGLMPGSRKQEIERHLTIQLKVAENLIQKIPNLKVCLLLAPTLSKELVQEKIQEFSVPIILVQDIPFAMISLTDGILAASGTATLMIGLMEKPMVIMYKMSRISAFIARRFFSGFFGLVNILSQKEIVPEIFQEKATPEVLTPLMEKALLDKIYRQKVQEDLHLLRESLGQRGVTQRVAKAVERFLNK